MPDFDFSGGGGKRDILGLALGLMQQRRQQANDAKDEAYRQQVSEQRRQKMQTDALRDSLKALKDSGGNKKLAEAVLEAQTGGDFPDHYRTLIGESAKQFKQQAAIPGKAAQEDAAKGVAANLDQPGDPLQNALEALRSYPDAGPQMNTQIAMRGGSILSDRLARRAAETTRMEQQARITEESQARRAATRAGAAEKKPTAAVEAAWETYLSAGVPFEEWRQQAKLEGVPASVIGDAMKHPAYREMLRVRRAPPGWRPPMALPGTVAGGTGGAPGVIQTPYGTLRQVK